MAGEVSVANVVAWRLVRFIVLAFVLGGCSFGHYWTKSGSTEADFKRDYYQCYQDARFWGGSEASRSRRMCLEAKGYEMDGMRMGFSGRWKQTGD
jgi:hypothetical protein